MQFQISTVYKKFNVKRKDMNPYQSLKVIKVGPTHTLTLKSLSQ